MLLYIQLITMLNKMASRFYHSSHKSSLLCKIDLIKMIIIDFLFIYNKKGNASIPLSTAKLTPSPFSTIFLFCRLSLLKILSQLLQRLFLNAGDVGPGNMQLLRYFPLRYRILVAQSVPQL